MSDREAVSAVLDEYGAGIDNKDWELVRSVFADGATVDYSCFGGPKGAIGDFTTWVEGAMGGFPMTQHHITNRRITVDGDTAHCDGELFGVMGMGAGDGQLTFMFTGCVYRDDFVRTPDGWKIANRVCDRGWTAAGPAGSGPNAPA